MKHKKRWIIGGTLIVLVVIAGIMDAAGLLDDAEPAPTAAPEPPQSPTPEEWPPADGAVTRTQFEDRGLVWPLTATEGVLACEAGAVTVTVDGTEYAVNGVAAGEDITPVWAEDADLAAELEAAGADDVTVPRAPIGDLIDAGLELCEQ